MEDNMAYFVQLNDAYSIYRKHGKIGLWQKNPFYGYDAALDYVEDMSLETLDRWSLKAGVTTEAGRAAYEAVVRKGGAGMIPQPEFNIATDL
jgi:hypothetical protein